MKRSILYIVLILAIPALCHGSIGPEPRLGFPVLETGLRDAYYLELENIWQEATFNADSFDLTPVAGERIIAGGSFYEIRGGVAPSDRPAPSDMISMMSFVWAEMFGGVDIVAEVKDFARQVRYKRRRVRSRRSQRRDLRNRWRFIVTCRVDQQTEVAAFFTNRGRFLGEGNMALEINALDPMSEEIGLTMAYSDGDFYIRADRMTLTETAAAKLMVKF